MRRRTAGRFSVVAYALRAGGARRRSLRAGVVLVLAVVTSLLGCSSHASRHVPTSGPRTGAVTGYIAPCSGMALPVSSTGRQVFSAAATVEALRGREYLKPVGPGMYRVVFPSAVAGRERVGENQEFRFGHLSPGRYVVLARYARGNVSTFLDVAITPGTVLTVDLPNTCK